MTTYKIVKRRVNLLMAQSLLEMEIKYLLLCYKKMKLLFQHHIQYLQIIDTNKLFSEYLMMWFRRPRV